MKPIFNSLLVIATFLVTVASFAKEKTSKYPISLRSEIVELIGKKVPMEAKESLTVRVYFVINNQNELVVVDVISKNKSVNSYIKEKINYKKITNTSRERKQEIYVLPIKVKS